MICSEMLLIRAGANVSLLKDRSRCKHSLGSFTGQSGWPNGGTGNRDDRSIITGLPVFFSPYPPLSFRLVSILFTFCLPFFLFHFLTPFPLTAIEHLPSLSPGPPLILSVPLGLTFLPLRCPPPSHAVPTVISPFGPRRGSRLPRQRDGTWGLTQLISVPARFFPMAEHKTGSLSSWEQTLSTRASLMVEREPRASPSIQSN